MAPKKTVFTTGEIAKICSVAPRTVSKWFDSGQLRGYRIPGSRDRRVPVEQLIRFMRAHDIPLNGLDAGTTRILVAEQNADLCDLLARTLASIANYEVRSAENLFEAAFEVATFKPNVMLVDMDLPGLLLNDVVHTLRDNPDVLPCRLIAMTGPIRDGERHALREQGFDGCVAKPFEASQVLRTIQEVLAAPR